MDEVNENLQRSVFFHGTSLESARAIIQDGFRVWHEHPEFGRMASGGNLGNGIYLSCRWSTALWFGVALLRVTLRPGTRVLDTSIPADPKTLRHLKREFGQEILDKPPWVALPHNKKLKGSELIEIFRYHYWRAWRPQVRRRADWYTRFALLGQYRSMLIRYGFHAYGHPADDNGIVVFSGDRIHLLELVGVLPEEVLHFDLGDPPFDDLAGVREAARVRGPAEWHDLAAQVSARSRLRPASREGP